MRTARLIVALSLITSSLVAAGCTHPYAARQNAHRQGQVEWVADSYAEREARCESNLQKTVVMFDESGVPNGDIDNAIWTWIWLVH